MPPSILTSAPRIDNTSVIVSTSAKRGASWITHFSLESNAATIIGKIAFLAPLMVTVPSKVEPPVTIILFNDIPVDKTAW